MTVKSRFVCIVFFLSLLCLVSANGQVRLPKLISDGMVLQRGDSVKIWGWAFPGENISVHFAGEQYMSTAGPSGVWTIMLFSLKPGGPYKMEIKASNSVTLNNILIGDVWLCSGQSNMELPMRRVQPLYEKEIAGSDNDLIRCFTVPKKYDFKEPHHDLDGGNWLPANPENVLNFSAVAYFFALELYNKYKVPVGIINASLGGTPAEAWMSEKALKQFPDHYLELQRFKSDSLINNIESLDRTRIRDWYDLLHKSDKGLKDTFAKWYNPELNTSDWKKITVPGYWSGTELRGLNGVAWFRKEIMIPPEAAGAKGRLNLGRIIDADSVFINGIFIGTTSYQYPPRRYTVPAGILKEGKNTLTVRVISNTGDGGFVPDKPYELVAGDFKTDLSGDWIYKTGAVMPPLRAQTFISYKPAGLFNAMLAPLLDYRIKGVIWYQGESNAGRPEEYRSLFPAMIRDWRNSFRQGDFPFLFVQLPNFMERDSMPSESNWAMLREAQLKTLSLPATGMAVTIDIGEWNDVHPLNKKDVGRRLALAAQKVANGDNEVVYSGPVYRSIKLKCGRAVLSFNCPVSGLYVKGGGKLRQFAIAGADMHFVWADAMIRGNKVVVRSREVKKPVAVRYAWGNNPEGANLYNRENLPASPFRTDLGK